MLKEEEESEEESSIESPSIESSSIESPSIESPSIESPSTESPSIESPSDSYPRMNNNQTLLQQQYTTVMTQFRPYKESYDQINAIKKAEDASQWEKVFECSPPIIFRKKESKTPSKTVLMV